MAWKNKEDDFFNDDDTNNNEERTPEKEPSKKRKKETVRRWGSPENRRLKELVEDGTINLRKKATCPRIDRIREKHFPGRSLRSFREHYRGLVAELLLDRKLTGGRKRLAGK
jgi:hypothetical protein